MSRKVVYTWENEEQGVVQRKETGSYENTTSISIPTLESKLEIVEAKAEELRTEIAEVKRGLIYPPMNHDELDAVAADVDLTWSASSLTKEQKIEELIANS